MDPLIIPYIFWQLKQMVRFVRLCMLGAPSSRQQVRLVRRGKEGKPFLTGQGEGGIWRSSFDRSEWRSHKIKAKGGLSVWAEPLWCILDELDMKLCEDLKFCVASPFRN
jgi:hypothetical protein